MGNPSFANISIYKGSEFFFFLLKKREKIDRRWG
jgi:hypothetical protein